MNEAISSAVVPVATRTGTASGSGGSMANISSYNEIICRSAVPPTAPVPPRKTWASRNLAPDRAASTIRGPSLSFLNDMVSGV